MGQPKFSSVTETCALRLLDLMHYFHLNAALTVENNSSEFLWSALWCPLLQGIALFCCDSRRPVRTCALTFLQRALLLHDLKVLSASQWENCFNKVLFPLLSKLLEPINMCDPIGMDETRMRTTNLLCKKEAIPESLKNILLVMETAGCFNDTLAAITWDRIATFLPHLHQDLLPPQINANAEDNTNNTQTGVGGDETAPLRSNELPPVESPTPPLPPAVPLPPQPPYEHSNQITSQTVDPNVTPVPAVGLHMAAVPPYLQTVIPNSTFIDMEEGHRQPLFTPVVAAHQQPAPQPVYHPMPTYPGTIEPFVPPPTGVPNAPPTVATAQQQHPHHPPNAQVLSAYPWPAPSDQKNY
ncbi:unnamed protein product [Medioppia subpectinata]|uniref:GBF1-like tetratricopeptide repeats domain-containing protein n=1 Tax=Medioppia subpectinata TaxID=1979941 RepID=A0A7R9KLY6_9ACAR|nr:unnamed protein product [Medioppia subpectinata]CAG2105682.1 unnamed protein product [Medioppia subpectinata]